MNSVIRLAFPDEAARLSELAFRSKAYWGYSAVFMESCRAELTISNSFIQENPTFVIERTETMIGFYTLERISETEVELGRLFIEPSEIGCGHGRRLMEHAKQQARSLGYRYMAIQGDPNAEPFYRASGAKLIGMKESASIPGRKLPLLRVEL